YAVRAFEVNAVDYLLKPVDKSRLRETLNRAQDRMEHEEIVAEHSTSTAPFLERIPVRHREEVFIVPVQQIASIVADGELLNITATLNEGHSVTYPPDDLRA